MCHSNLNVAVLLIICCMAESGALIKQLITKISNTLIVYPVILWVSNSIWFYVDATDSGIYKSHDVMHVRQKCSNHCCIITGNHRISIRASHFTSFSIHILRKSKTSREWHWRDVLVFIFTWAVCLWYNGIYMLVLPRYFVFHVSVIFIKYRLRIPITMVIVTARSHIIILSNTFYLILLKLITFRFNIVLCILF